MSDDLRFALIDFTWARDPHFEHFLSWSANAAGIADWAIPDIDLPEFKWPHGRWVKPTPSSVPNPYDGGTDPLHLAHHLGGLGFAPRFASPEVVLAQSSDPRGYVIADDVFTWYHALHHETRLSDRHHSGRSWRIDVIVKSVGHLGTFRKSRETKRWFAGPHRFHMMGNE